MKKAIRWVIAIVVIVALVGGGFYAYQKYVVPQQGAINISTLQVVKLNTGSVSQTINSTGTVRTKQTAQVTWQASGKVGKINVKVGDQVKANDGLATLNPGFLPNNILQAQQNLVTDQQALDDLLNNQTNLPQAEKGVLDAQTAVTKAQTTRVTLNTARGTPGQIANTQAIYLLAQQTVNQLQSKYDSTPGEPNTDDRKAVALANLVYAKQRMDTALFQMQWIQGKPSASDIATADNNLALAKANLADAQHSLDLVKNGPDNANVAAANQKIAADQATIRFQSVTAPFNGTITVVSNMIGDTVSNNTPAFRIDDLSAYYIDLQVAETDIAKIQVSQPVMFCFDAIPNKTYNGLVTSVGQVGTSASGVVSFTVTVQITDADASVKPGMTASGAIVVATSNDVLVIPSRAIRTVNNRQVVYVLSSTPITAITSVAGGGSGAGTGTGGTQSTRQPGAGQTGTGTGRPGGGTGTTGGTGGTGNFSGFAGNFNRVTLKPIATTNGESLIPIQVQVGIASDAFTQIISNRLKIGDLIVVNMPASATTTSNLSVGGGGFGGGGGGPAGGGGFGRGGG